MRIDNRDFYFLSGSFLSLKEVYVFLREDSYTVSVMDRELLNDTTKFVTFLPSYIKELYKQYKRDAMMVRTKNDADATHSYDYITYRLPRPNESLKSTDIVYKLSEEDTYGTEKELIYDFFRMHTLQINDDITYKLNNISEIAIDRIEFDPKSNKIIEYVDWGYDFEKIEPIENGEFWEMFKQFLTIYGETSIYLLSIAYRLSKPQKYTLPPPVVYLSGVSGSGKTLWMKLFSTLKHGGISSKIFAEQYNSQILSSSMIGVDESVASDVKNFNREGIKQQSTANVIDIRAMRTDRRKAYGRLFFLLADNALSDSVMRRELCTTNADDDEAIRRRVTYLYFTEEYKEKMKQSPLFKNINYFIENPDLIRRCLARFFAKCKTRMEGYDSGDGVFIETRFDIERFTEIETRHTLVVGWIHDYIYCEKPFTYRGENLYLYKGENIREMVVDKKTGKEREVLFFCVNENTLVSLSTHYGQLRFLKTNKELFRRLSECKLNKVTKYTKGDDRKTLRSYGFYVDELEKAFDKYIIK